MTQRSLIGALLVGATLGGLLGLVRFPGGSDAEAYPGFRAIAGGTNPVAVNATSMGAGGPYTAFDNSGSAQDFVVTDVVIGATAASDCRVHVPVSFHTQPGNVAVSEVAVPVTRRSEQPDAGPVALTLSSGIRVPAGHTLEAFVGTPKGNGSNCPGSISLYTTFSGYRAVP